MGQPGHGTHPALAGGKRQGPEAVVTSSVRAAVTARSILATAEHWDDVGAWSGEAGGGLGLGEDGSQDPGEGSTPGLQWGSRRRHLRQKGAKPGSAPGPQDLHLPMPEVGGVIPPVHRVADWGPARRWMLRGGGCWQPRPLCCSDQYNLGGCGLYPITVFYQYNLGGCGLYPITVFSVVKSSGS